MPRYTVLPRSVIESIIISLQLSSKTLTELARDTGYSAGVLQKYLDALEYLNIVYFDDKTRRWCLRKLDKSLVREICDRTFREFLGNNLPEVLKEISLEDLTRILESAIDKAWRCAKCFPR